MDILGQQLAVHTRATTQAGDITTETSTTTPGKKPCVTGAYGPLASQANLLVGTSRTHFRSSNSTCGGESRRGLGSVFLTHFQLIFLLLQFKKLILYSLKRKEIQRGTEKSSSPSSSRRLTNTTAFPIPQRNLSLLPPGQRLPLQGLIDGGGRDSQLSWDTDSRKPATSLTEYNAEQTVCRGGWVGRGSDPAGPCHLSHFMGHLTK